MTLRTMFNPMGMIMRAPPEEGGGGGGGGAAGEGEGGGGGGAPASWVPATADATLVGFVQSKGWDKLDPAAAAIAAVQSYQEAQKFIGQAPDRLAVLPKDASDTEAWTNLRSKLGVPADAKDYDFSGVKLADGNAPSEDVLSWARQTAHALNLPKDAAPEFVNAILKRELDTAAAKAADLSARADLEKAELAKNWGANMDANKFLARRGAEKLGLDPEMVDLIEGQAGYAKTMEAFRKVGELAGEARFVNSDAGNGVMTREQAMSRKAELMNDKAWAASYLDGDAAKNREMMALNTLIVGDDTEASRMA